MSKLSLSFSIEGAQVTADEMGQFVASYVFSQSSEARQEDMGRDITRAIMVCVGRKVVMARTVSDRKDWIKRHPPNHAGFYYCHICGLWVHQDQAELDHVEPRSVRRGEDPDRDDNRRMAHAWPVIAPDGTEICPGNRGKGSRSIPSATMEIAPPDEES